MLFSSSDDETNNNYNNANSDNRRVDSIEPALVIQHQNQLESYSRLPIYSRPSVWEKYKDEPQLLIKKTITLIDDIGIDLYQQLSDEQKLLMIETAGTVDLGTNFDIDSLLKRIKNFSP